MNYKDVKLPREVIAEMYKSVLVASAPAKSQEDLDSKAQPANIALVPQHLGKNQKGIVVVVAGVKKMTETCAEIQFLLKILKACNLTLDDIAVVDQKNTTGGLDQHLASFTASKLLLFSSEVNEADIPEELYFQVREENDAHIVYAPEISILIKEDATATRYKKRLWQVLKSFFNV